MSNVSNLEEVTNITVSDIIVKLSKDTGIVDVGTDASGIQLSVENAAPIITVLQDNIAVSASEQSIDIITLATQGAQGSRGEKGDTGEAGPEGPQGETGMAGADGAAGIQGEKGEVGPEGPQGKTGITGADGVAGTQGEKGEKGEVGPQGQAGVDGSDATAVPAGSNSQIQYNSGGVFAASSSLTFDGSSEVVMGSGGSFSLGNGNSYTSGVNVGAGNTTRIGTTIGRDNISDVGNPNNIAIGARNICNTVSESVAIGYNCESTGFIGCISIGYNCKASGFAASAALGISCDSTNTGAVAIGNSIDNGTRESCMIGYGATNLLFDSVGRITSSNGQVQNSDGSYFFPDLASEPATPAAGGVIYIEAGALKYKGSSGTVTTLGAA